MDGRSDFYGNQFVSATQHILGAQYDWKDQLQHFGIDMVLVKPDAPLATVLKTASGWKVLFDDGKVLVFEAAAVNSRPSPKQVFGMPYSSVEEHK
jgi:hypothetical protein